MLLNFFELIGKIVSNPPMVVIKRVVGTICLLILCIWSNIHFGVFSAYNQIANGIEDFSYVVTTYGITKVYTSKIYGAAYGADVMLLYATFIFITILMSYSRYLIRLEKNKIFTLAILGTILIFGFVVGIYLYGRVTTDVSNWYNNFFLEVTSPIAFVVFWGTMFWGFYKLVK